MKTCDSLFGENINPREDFSLHSTKYTRWTLFQFGPISVLFTCNSCDVFFSSTNLSVWESLSNQWLHHISTLSARTQSLCSRKKWLSPARLLATLLPFHRQLLQLWHKCSGGGQPIEPCSYEGACAEPLWGNPLIVDKHQRPLYFPSWPGQVHNCPRDI